MTKLLVLAWLAAAPEAPALVDDPAARAVVQRALSFFGGEAAALAHETQVTTTDVVLADGTKARRVTWVRCPGKAREELTVGRQVLVVATDGTTTWRGSRRGAQPTRSLQLQGSLRVACLGRLLADAARGRAAIASLPSSKGAARVRIDAGDERVVLDVDPTDGRPRRLELSSSAEAAPPRPRPDDGGLDAPADAAPVLVVELLAWSQESGYPVPRRSRWQVQGAQAEERSVVSVGRNARLADAFFSPQPLGLEPPDPPGAIEL